MPVFVGERERGQTLSFMFTLNFHSSVIRKESKAEEVKTREDRKFGTRSDSN